MPSPGVGAENQPNVSPPSGRRPHDVSQGTFPNVTVSAVVPSGCVSTSVSPSPPRLKFVWSAGGDERKYLRRKYSSTPARSACVSAWSKMATSAMRPSKPRMLVLPGRSQELPMYRQSACLNDTDPTDLSADTSRFESL